jgi:hypothetical protein
MNKQEKIKELVDKAFTSLDDIQKAEGKPFLLTRINAKMQPSTSTAWDTALAFISKPLVAIACMAFIIAINVFVLSSNNKTINTTEDAYAIADDYSSSNIAINDFENIEP